MFGVGDFWLETRVIIKISTQETLTDFHGNETKKIFHFFKMADSKKKIFSKPPIPEKKFPKFQGLVGLIDANGIDVVQPIWLRDFSDVSSKNSHFLCL